MANTMPINMVKTALYSINIQLDEETIQLMSVTYTTKVFNPYKTSVLFVGHRQIVQAKIRRHRLQCLIRFSTEYLQNVLLKFELEDRNGLVHLIKAGSFIRLKRAFCFVFAMPMCASVYMCLMITCWERVDFLALVCCV